MKHYDEHVCMSVCPIAYLKTTCSNYTNFLYVEAWSSSDDNAIYCASGFVDHITFSYSNANTDTGLEHAT